MPSDMKAFEEAHPNMPVMMAPFLPTMDFAEYAAAKSGATLAPNALRSAIAFAVSPYAPPTHGVAKCNGLGQNQPVTGGQLPPDTHGAVGANHFGQVVNSAIQFYTKGLTGRCPTSIVLSTTLNAFMGYANQTLFDPRLLYDMTYNRWIVSAEAFPESSSTQFQFIAVSVDSDPTHGFFTYPFNMTGLIVGGPDANFFWDFPDVGYDEEAIALTGNVFDPLFAHAEVIFLPKHRMYAGLNFSFCLNNLGNGGTATPNNVLDQSPFTTITMALRGSSPGKIRVTKWTGTSHVCPTLVGGPTDLTSSFDFTLPPFAPQPGTDQVLDTSDTRFETAGTQFGEPVFGQPIRLWQVHTVGSGGLPTPIAYRIDVGSDTIEEQCTFFATVDSSDFNASIVANGAGTTFIAWSSTDVTNNHSPQARFTGKKLGDACSTLTPGILDKESIQPLTGNFDSMVGAQRWGDYSAVTLDPADTTQAWGVNETVAGGSCASNPALTCWKSHFGSMSNP
jgi:hypothetical protein